MPVSNPQDFKTQGEFRKHVSVGLENDSGGEKGGDTSEEIIFVI